jgi:hypothetical protein
VDPEDVVHDSLLAAFRALRNGTRPDNFGGWIHVIVRNGCADAARLRAATVPAELAAGCPASESAHDAAVQREPECVRSWARASCDNDLVKVAYANDGPEAELLQGPATDCGQGSVRDVLVAASDVPVARGVLREVTRVSPGHRRGPATTGGRGWSPRC